MNANVNRIELLLMTLKQHTATPGHGVTRLTYTREHLGARRVLFEAMEKYGLTISEDGFGNMFGKLEGTDPTLPSVLIGSHIDSVPNGGAYDGAAGVAVALEVAAMFHENKLQPKRSVEFVALIEEEGARFPGGLLGSRSMLGDLSVEEFEHLKSFDGLTTVAAIEQIGLDLPERKPRPIDTIHSFLELHIEQGPILTENNKQIGIVETIVGLAQLEVTVQGRAGHAGTTPMDKRADALVTASKIVANLPTLIQDQTALGTVITVGQMDVHPNSPNVIPERVHFTIDLRSSTLESIEAAKSRLNDFIELHESEHVEVTIEETLNVTPRHMDETLQQHIYRSCSERNYSSIQMSSGAGHDAMVFADYVPTAMIFVPTENSVSHAPEETASTEDLARGANVFFDTVVQLTEPEIVQR